MIYDPDNEACVFFRHGKKYALDAQSMFTLVTEEARRTGLDVDHMEPTIFRDIAKRVIIKHGHRTSIKLQRA